MDVFVVEVGHEMFEVDIDGGQVRRRGRQNIYPDPRKKRGKKRKLSQIQVGFGEVVKNPILSPQPEKGKAIIIKDGQRVVFAIGPIDLFYPSPN